MYPENAFIYFVEDTGNKKSELVIFVYMRRKKRRRPMLTSWKKIVRKMNFNYTAVTKNAFELIWSSDRFKKERRRTREI